MKTMFLEAAEVELAAAEVGCRGRRYRIGGRGDAGEAQEGHRHRQRGERSQAPPPPPPPPPPLQNARGRSWNNRIIRCSRWPWNHQVQARLPSPKHAPTRSPHHSIAAKGQAAAAVEPSAPHPPPPVSPRAATTTTPPPPPPPSRCPKRRSSSDPYYPPLVDHHYHHRHHLPVHPPTTTYPTTHCARVRHHQNSPSPPTTCGTTTTTHELAPPQAPETTTPSRAYPSGRASLCDDGVPTPSYFWRRRSTLNLYRVRSPPTHVRHQYGASADTLDVDVCENPAAGAVRAGHRAGGAAL